MKEQALIKKIEDQAKIFKSRAITGHGDGKRHDLVKPDEQKSMWTAQKRLDWSPQKIGGILNRDWRTVKQAIESYKLAEQATQQQQKATANAEAVLILIEHQLQKHFDDLAQTAKILAHRVERLLSYKDTAYIVGDIVSGASLSSKVDGQVVTGWLREKEYDAKHQIEPYLATCLFAHYESKFGKLSFKEWSQLSTGNVNCEIVNNLKFLAYGKLKVCRDCPICLQM